MLTTAAGIDPVCGMSVDPEHAAGSFDYQGKTYYFCSTHCVHRFRDNPDSFLHKPQPIAITRQSTTSNQKYTCPMHPEIIRDGPGSCPICGMALEPVTVSLQEEENQELRDMSRRFWLSAILSLPVLILGMGEMLLPHHIASMAVWLQ